MIRAVFDTNIYLSSLLFAGKPRQILLAAHKARIKLFVSKQILAELRGVLRKKFNYPLEEINKAEEIILRIAVIVEPKLTVKAIKDEPMDNHVLACALDCKADFLVSGDKKHLLVLKEFKHVKIVSAGQFLEVLEK